MKTAIAVAVALFCVFHSTWGVQSAQLTCGHKKPDIPTEWIDMVSPCVESMRKQIREELKASMQYLAMGAHFSTDTVNLPGFAKMFFEAASEERDHAIKLISYLLMRGELKSSVSNLISKNLDVATVQWSNGTAALKDALKLEAYVTKNIKNVIKDCESGTNDYHLVDYLTGVFLEEQYKGQREIAGKVSTLAKLLDTHGPLGEFLFDKKLLHGEIL